MKQHIINFLFRLLVVFMIIMSWGIVYKPSDVNFDGVIRALVIAFASALSWMIGEYVVNRRSKL